MGTLHSLSPCVDLYQIACADAWYQDLTDRIHRLESLVQKIPLSVDGQARSRSWEIPSFFINTKADCVYTQHRLRAQLSSRMIHSLQLQACPAPSRLEVTKMRAPAFRNPASSGQTWCMEMAEVQRLKCSLSAKLTTTTPIWTTWD